MRFIKNSNADLYFIQTAPNDPNTVLLNYFSLENNNFRTIISHHYDRLHRFDLHSFNNTLVMCPERETSKIIMLDLVTEKTNEVEFEIEALAVNCSSEEKLFVISAPDRELQIKTFTIETFDIVSFSEYSSTKITIDYNLPESRKFTNFLFAEYVDTFIYIFYQVNLNNESNIKHRTNYMMIICAKTFKVLKNIDIANDDHYHRDKIVKGSETWDLMENCGLMKFLYYKKEKKLFMQFFLDYVYLVFDIEKQLFYVQKCLLNKWMLYVSYFFDPKILVQDDQVFALFEFKRKVNGKKRYDLWTELRSYRFQKDGCLAGHFVGTEDKWKINKRKFSHKDCRHSRRLHSAVFVENVRRI